MASIISAGTTSATALNMSADTTGILQLASNNGTVGLTMTTAQNVGIGSTSPTNKLQVLQNGTNYQIRATGDGSGAGFLAYSNADTFACGIGGSTGGGFGVGLGFTGTLTNQPLLIVTNGTEKARITSGGLVGIGKTPADKSLEIFATGNTAIRLQNNDTGTGTGDGFLIEQSGLNSIINNYEAGALILQTSGTERARITGTGEFFVGNTSGFDVTSGAKNQFSGQIAVFNSGSPNTIMSFYNSSQSGRVGFIGSGNNSTSYNSGSDYRLKVNVANATGALSKLDALRPVTFNWISAPDGAVICGFIAHELQEVYPDAVTGEKDAMCSDGVTPDYQMVDHSKMVPLLVAAIQELNAKVTALENK